MDEAGEPWSDGLTGHSGARRPGFPVDPHRLQRAMLAGRFWLIGAGVLGVLVGFLYAKVGMSSKYETTVILRYEGDLQVGDLSPSGYGLKPAADALVHQSVLRKIRDELGFEGDLTALANWIKYDTDGGTGTLYFTVSGKTGEDAAEYARVVTDVFLAYHKERQSRRIDMKIARTEKRSQAAEEKAAEARRLYDEFRDEHGIANLSTEQQSMVQSAAQLRANNELAVLEIGVLEAKVRNLEAQLASTPKTSLVAGESSPERNTYNRLRQELANARVTLAPEHPRVQALQQQVEHLRSQLRSGGGASSSGGGQFGVNATYQVLAGQVRQSKSQLAALRERQKGLTTMANKARNRVEGFSDIEGEASALLAEVKVNESLVGELRRTEALLEDALHDPPSGFVVLDPGAVPEYPVKNKMKVVVFLAIPILSVAIALLVVLRREFAGLRLETPAEVAFWGNGPVLAATSWPDDPRGLGELVAGLDDFVPHAQGSLLIVGDTLDESRWAGQLANRMSNDWFPMDEPVDTPSTPATAPTVGSPLQTPPPSGPYPVHGSGARSVALVRQPVAPTAEPVELTRRVGHLRLEAWDGPLEGQALRRAARLADRVVVLVRSGAMPFYRLLGIQHRMGRQRGIGYIVIGLPHELGTRPDRAGNVAAFWKS